MISFGGHLEVTKFDLNQSFEEEPISRYSKLERNYKKYDFITHVQTYAHKAGLMKANDEVLGILLKGVTPDFDMARFKPNMKAGKFIQFNDSTDSKDVVVSSLIASKLNLKIGDDAIVFFIQNPVRFRRLTVTGIYETGMEDFDEKIVLCDLKLIQKINNWPDSLVGGFEVFVDNFKNINQYQRKLYDIVDYDHYVEKINDKYAEIFDWLSLLNRNVVIFLSLTLFVACFNMVSILLILIMERTNMIGTLKAFGAPNKLIRRIFIYNGMLLIAKGLLIGNIIGIGFGLLQEKFKLFHLDAKTYYMAYVPIHWDWQIIVLLNLLTFAVVSLVLVIPTLVISRMNPLKSIRFD